MNIQMNEMRPRRWQPVQYVLWSIFLAIWLLWGVSGCSDSPTNKMSDAAEVETNTEKDQRPPDGREPAQKGEPMARPDQVKTDGLVCQNKDLLDHSLWRQVSRESDPYKSMAPNKPCNDVAYKLEDGVIEVETGICSFLTVSQPLKTALKQGDKLKLVFWHLYLTAASSAEGYVGLSIGDTSIYVKKIPIPADPAVYEETITLKRDFSRGETLYFHIHNHGSNTWKLLSLEQVCP